jgi:hypothetical protein
MGDSHDVYCLPRVWILGDVISEYRVLIVEQSDFRKLSVSRLHRQGCCGNLKENCVFLMYMLCITYHLVRTSAADWSN